MDGEQVLIYVSGSDTQLREVGWALLGADLASQVDLLDRGRIYLKNGDTPKVSSGGRVITVISERAKLDLVMETIRRVYVDTDVRAYAVPILASL